MEGAYFFSKPLITLNQPIFLDSVTKLKTINVSSTCDHNTVLLTRPKWLFLCFAFGENRRTLWKLFSLIGGFPLSLIDIPL